MLWLLFVSSATGILAQQNEPLLIKIQNGNVQLRWEDPIKHFQLEKSDDLLFWRPLHPSLYSNSAPSVFNFSRPVHEGEYYRIRQVGENRIHVIGDSISLRNTWPDDLQAISGKHVFSQATGGAWSDIMLRQAAGVEFVYPRKNIDLISPGPVTIKWKRYNHFRMAWNQCRNEWAEYAKAVSEPLTIEVFNNGEWLGFAKRMVAEISTDYAHDQKKFFWTQHPLKNGDEVVFFANDAAYPSDLSVSDSEAEWRFSSPYLPSAIIERRVYYVANAQINDFEIKEQADSPASMNLGRDASGRIWLEYGWALEWNYPGGNWNLSWKSRTKYDDWIWLIEASANDAYSFRNTVTNTLLLLSQMTPVQQRFIIVCPPSGSSPARGPGSDNWVGYYENYLPKIVASFPSNHINTMALLDSMRAAKEKSFLDNPNVPELLWIRGSPTNAASWEAFYTDQGDTDQMWIGPGYIPLQYRNSFTDCIHLNESAYAFLAGYINGMIVEKGW